MSFFKYIRSARTWISSFGRMALTYVFSPCQSSNKFGFGHFRQAAEEEFKTLIYKKRNLHKRAGPLVLFLF